ncbi:RNA polymerase sigma factor [Paludibaculum fermentans]|uniref:RNA polymerase sigma factor n=1 Tax=Paludibaculum fermentans TaxID=1473598 RepID=UPI003EBA2256
MGVQFRLQTVPDERSAAEPQAESGRVVAGVNLHSQVERIYEETRGDLHLYLLCFRLPASQAEDLTQEAFVSLYRALSKGQEIQAVRPWLFRVARNLALKARSRDSAFLAIDADLDRTIEATGSSPEAALIERQRMSRLNEAVGLLSPQQKECLHLRAAGLRYREIAEAIGISSSTVSEFLRRGLCKLRRSLNE